MNVALRSRPMTRQEFFDWAQAHDGRYEFDGCQPVAMVGGTNIHGIIAGNVFFELRLRLGGGPCMPMGTEGGGVATTDERVRYPDVSVTCSQIPSGERLLPNPVVVFEVVSPSSVRTDQGLKLREYHAVPTIKRYVLIEQTGIMVTVHSRQRAEPWTTTVLTDGDVLATPEIGIEVPIAAFYAGTELATPEPDAVSASGTKLE